MVSILAFFNVFDYFIQMFNIHLPNHLSRMQSSLFYPNQWARKNVLQQRSFSSFLFFFPSCQNLDFPVLSDNVKGASF